MDDNKVAVSLEDLRAQFRTFGEGLDGLKDELKDFRNETNHRLDSLENKVTNHSIEFKSFKTDNKQDHQQLMQAIKETDTEVQKLKRIK
jgi:Sec-independent protein translocase protein TatA